MRVVVAAAALTLLLVGAEAAQAAPPPLQLKQRCITRAERAGIVRFSAPDRVRLIGVVFGRGPNAVVLAHQGTPEALCSWVPYARSLARAGYRVLAFDHRGRGSSSIPTRPDRFRDGAVPERNGERGARARDRAAPCARHHRARRATASAR